MKTPTFALMLLLALSAAGCLKEIFGEDDVLSLKRQPYTGTEMRTDGYYYFETDGRIFDVLFFYRDGTLLEGDGGQPIDSIALIDKKHLDSEWIKSSKKYKINWGLFAINNNQIQYEKWYPSSGGPFRTYIRSGEILNDTAFVIKMSARSDGSSSMTLDRAFRFRPFSPKPDSTNQFVP